MSSLTRTRWAAIGAAVAVTLGAGGVGLVAATSPAGAATFVPIEPCRVIDTRPEPDFNVGDKSSPVGPNETHTVDAHGDNGQCVGIPATATGLVLNVTAVGATQPTFLTLWGDGDRPNASHLNPAPGQPPTPNAVSTGLTTDGQFNVYNRFGNVHVLADIVGYYTDHHHDDRYYTETEVDTALAAKQDACAPGTVLAYAQVFGPALPNAFTDVNGFNCTGGIIQAFRNGEGQYRIRFEDLPLATATDGLVVHVTAATVLTMEPATSSGLIATYLPYANGDLRIELRDHEGTSVDATFSVSLLDPGSES